jgi:hypothetical protein
MIRIVRVLGSCWAAKRAQWMACCKSFFLWGCTYPIPCHLCLKDAPREPNIELQGNGEKKLCTWVEHASGEEKYEWIILKFDVGILGLDRGECSH